jgi:hypothetical protein
VALNKNVVRVRQSAKPLFKLFHPLAVAPERPTRETLHNGKRVLDAVV